MMEHNIAKSVSDLIADWPREDVFDAQRILDENPEFKDDHSVVLDLAYEEYCRRIDHGEELELSGFAARFPEVETPLLDLIDVHQVLYDNPSVLTQQASPRWPDVGESLLDLKLLEKIGSGSFSQVYIASECGVGERRVVAKLCTNANHEASLLGRLEHPNIVPILSVKTDNQKNNLSAICMPYMSRTTLAHAIEFLHNRGHRATPGDLVKMLFTREREAVSTPAQTSGFSRRSQLQDVMIEIAVQLCRGLEFAHSQGVIHGDLKPSNILLTKQGTALLMDFNLSQQLQPDSQALGGTLAYMAPEQLATLSQHQLQPQPVSCNEQTDVYSFGVLLAELFTGSHPFGTPPQKGAPADSAGKLFEQQRTKSITASDLAPQTGMALATIIEKCLAFVPDQRWKNVTQLRAALEQTLTLKSRALRRIRRERRRIAVIGAALSVMLIASGLIYANLPSESERLVGRAAEAMQQNRPGEAIEALLKAQQLGRTTRETDSLLVDAYLALGNQFLKADNYPPAIQQFIEAQRHDPTSKAVEESLLNAYLQSGFAAFARKDFSAAAADFSKANDLAPGSPDILLPLSRALVADHQFDNAINTAEQWRSLDRDSSPASANLALCYFRKGEHNDDRIALLKSQTEFENALKLPGGVSRAAIHSNIGLCHLKFDRLKEAIKAFSDAKHHYPDFASPANSHVPHQLYMKLRTRLEFRSDSFGWKRDLDFSWVEDCVKEAPKSVEIYLEAAYCYASASSQSHSQPELCQQFREQCIAYCHRAETTGMMTTSDLQKLLFLEAQLKTHEDWSSLMGNAIEREEPEDDSFLLEPLLKFTMTPGQFTR